MTMAQVPIEFKAPIDQVLRMTGNIDAETQKDVRLFMTEVLRTGVKDECKFDVHTQDMCKLQAELEPHGVDLDINLKTTLTFRVNLLKDDDAECNIQHLPIDVDLIESVIKRD